MYTINKKSLLLFFMDAVVDIDSEEEKEEKSKLIRINK